MNQFARQLRQFQARVGGSGGAGAAGAGGALLLAGGAAAVILGTASIYNGKTARLPTFFDIQNNTNVILL